MKSIAAEIHKFPQQKNFDNKKNINQLGFEFVTENNFNVNSPKNTETMQEFKDYLILNTEKNINFLQNIIKNTDSDIITTLISNIQNQILGTIGLIIPKTKNDKNIFFYIPLFENKTSDGTTTEPINFSKFIEFITFLFSVKKLDFKTISYNFKYQFVLLNNSELLKNLITKNLFDIQIASYLLNPTKNDYSLQNIVDENLGIATAVLDFCLP